MIGHFPEAHHHTLAFKILFRSFMGNFSMNSDYHASDLFLLERSDIYSSVFLLVSFDRPIELTGAAIKLNCKLNHQHHHHQKHHRRCVGKYGFSSAG